MVAAKGPPVDPSNLSGFTCESSHSYDESFDSNYKVFKNQNGEYFLDMLGLTAGMAPLCRKFGFPKGALKVFR